MLLLVARALLLAGRQTGLAFDVSRDTTAQRMLDGAAPVLADVVRRTRFFPGRGSVPALPAKAPGSVKHCKIPRREALLDAVLRG